MKYKDKKSILIGDKVYIKSEDVIGIVESIIEDSKDTEYWGVSENGIMLKENKIFGRLFIPKAMVYDLELIKRGGRKVEMLSDNDNHTSSKPT